MAASKGGVFLFVFGSLFFAVGVGMGVFSARTLMRVSAMRSWQETPARLSSCELKVSHDSDGSSYRVNAAYAYTVNGVNYTGDRVSPHGGGDNIGHFQQETYARLKRSLDRKETVSCWVNPQNPSDAVLIRAVRPELLIFYQLFVFAFGGAGFAVMAAAVLAMLQPSSAPSCGQGSIRMRGASAHRVALALAVVVNAYLVWFLWTTMRCMAPDPLPWYLWLLTLAGVIPAVSSAYLTGRRLKYGVSVFEMAPMPGVLGGPVSGTIRIPAKVEAAEGFVLTLQCFHQYTTKRGSESSTTNDVVWNDTQRLPSGYSFGEETMLPVRFAVPYNQSATTAAGGRDGYYWRLSVAAETPGIDYKAVFDVPVQKTAQSSPNFTPVTAPDGLPFDEPVERVLERNRLRLTPRADGGFELVFPAGRMRGAAVFLFLFWLVWTGVCVFLWTKAHAPLLFPLVFSAMDVVVFAILLSVSVLSRGVVVDRGQRVCMAWWRLLAGRRHERSVPFDAVLEVRSEHDAQSGNTQYYRVVLVPDGRSPRTLGAGLTSWRDADAIAAMIQKSIGQSG